MPGLTVTRFTAAAASVAACAATLLVASSSPVEAVPGLAGRSYVSVSVTPAPIPGGGPLRIAFAEKDRVSLSAGCNRMIGTVTAKGDRLVFSQLASTKMACPPPRDHADAWAVDFAKQSPTYRLVGPGLTLSTPTTTVLLREDSA